MKTYTTVDEYIKNAPLQTQKALRQLRATIKKAAPKAKDRISYGICGFFTDRAVIYYGGYAKHVSIYPRTSGMIKAYGKEIAPYTKGKGTLQFPLDKKLPVGLIAKLVKVRLKEVALKNKKHDSAK